VGTTRKFYVAEDLASLKMALEKIFTVVLGEGQSLCDDSCYAPDVGCPNPGDMCIRGKCAQNPCAGINCGPGLYCYTDGVAPGRCIAPCKKACQPGYRCEQGLCIQSACPSVCIAGFVCNAQSGHCEPDPLCPANPPRQDQCRVPSACQFGTCVDDPCKFVKCPVGSRCVPWDGSCEFAPGTGPQVDMSSGGDDVDIQNRQAGCTIGGNVAAPGFLLATLLVLAALLLGRRHRSDLPS
jgi:MYXO-CTERM domain-containing protein